MAEIKIRSTGIPVLAWANRLASSISARHHATIDHHERQPRRAVVEHQATRRERVVDLRGLRLQKPAVDDHRQRARGDVDRGMRPPPETPSRRGPPLGRGRGTPGEPNQTGLRRNRVIMAVPRDGGGGGSTRPEDTRDEARTPKLCRNRRTGVPRGTILSIRRMIRNLSGAAALWQLASQTGRAAAPTEAKPAPAPTEATIVRVGAKESVVR